MRPSPSYSCALGAAAALLLAGCMTWHTAAQPPRDLLAAHPPVKVRAVLADGRWLTLYRPFIRNDSLGGTPDTARRREPTMVSLADVHHLEVERVNAAGTVVAVAGVGLGVAAVVAMVNAVEKIDLRPVQTSSNWDMKMSCPLVYSWDGRHWRLDSGTFGGAIVEALQRTDLDNLDFATPEDGVLRLRVANELAETDHLDALAVLAVDHEPGVTVAPDPQGGIHTLGTLVAPVRATDDRGADALPRVRDADGRSWESAMSGRDPRVAADLRSGLELAFVRPAGARRAHLVVDGNSSTWGSVLLGQFIAAHGNATQAWYDSLNAAPAAARAVQARLAREAFLAASVRTDTGWAPVGLFWEAGPEVVKRQVMDVDLSGVAGDTVIVRLQSAPSFWTVDRVAMDFTADRPVTVRELPLLAARSDAGRDVAPLIRAVDHRDYALAHGDAALVTFAVPPLPAGTARTWLLRSTGWYRVDTPESGAPDPVALGSVAHDSLAVGRASVARLNTALALLAESAR